MPYANLLNLKKLSSNSDLFGATASGICLVHCVATPFLFVAHAEMHQHGHPHGASPFWWNVIDIFFLVISLAAVYWSAKSSSETWVKAVLYFSWLFLAFLNLNEKFGGIHLPEALIYIPAVSLIVFHLYNKKYCQCRGEDCIIEK